MKFRNRTVLFLATGFFTGTVPFAPGTFGSLIGLPLFFFLSHLNILRSFAWVLLFVIFSVWIASAAEKILNEEDSPRIVIDEIAGMTVVFLGLPFNMITAGAGFLIFRIFDIWKPFPIRMLERKVRGGFGIVLDDVLAGVYANLILRLIFAVQDWH